MPHSHLLSVPSKLSDLRDGLATTQWISVACRCVIRQSALLQLLEPPFQKPRFLVFCVDAVGDDDGHVS